MQEPSTQDLRRRRKIALCYPSSGHCEHSSRASADATRDETQRVRSAKRFFAPMPLYRHDCGGSAPAPVAQMDNRQVVFEPIAGVARRRGCPGGGPSRHSGALSHDFRVVICVAVLPVRVGSGNSPVHSAAWVPGGFSYQPGSE